MADGTIWNGFPFLFYDTGAYFSRPIDGTLTAGRSMIYGAWLAALRSPFFWPVVIAQAATSVWLIHLILRSHALGERKLLPWALLGISAALAAFTALPWFAGQLMPDLFAGLAVLALYLLVFKRAALSGFERIGLVAVIVFACAVHNATLAVIAGLLLLAAIVWYFRRDLVPAAALKQAGLALLLSLVLVPSANYAFASRLAWTPGGAGFVFGRLVQDGIAQRYLADHCPNAKLKLCDVRHALPNLADDFLWHQGAHGPFAYIGGFEGGADEMAFITRDSLLKYSGMHVATALRTMAEQMVSVKSGDGIVHNVWDAYGVIERLAPEMLPASHTSLQRQNKLQRTLVWINYFHQPIALGAMAMLPLILLLAWRRGTLRDTDLFAATILAALLANAFVTGVLSNPHHRYGARVAWLAPFLLGVIAIQFMVTARGWQEAILARLSDWGFLPEPARAELSRDRSERSHS
jgi:hypothetical protein